MLKLQALTVCTASSWPTAFELQSSLDSKALTASEQLLAEEEQAAARAAAKKAKKRKQKAKKQDSKAQQAPAQQQAVQTGVAASASGLRSFKSYKNAVHGVKAAQNWLSAAAWSCLVPSPKWYWHHQSMLYMWVAASCVWDMPNHDTVSALLVCFRRAKQAWWPDMVNVPVLLSQAWMSHILHKQQLQQLVTWG